MILKNDVLTISGMSGAKKDKAHEQNNTSLVMACLTVAGSEICMKNIIDFFEVSGHIC